MMPDYPLGETLDFKFTTRAFATGVPTTLGGTPVVQVYEDNSVTQITTGITLSADFDSVTGLNNVRIVATSGNGYESGKSYAAVISTGTVGGVSVVGEVVAQFSIERSPALRPTTAGRTLDVTATGAAGIDWGNVENPTTAVDLSATDIQLCDTVTTLTGHTAQTGDSFARIGVAGAGLTNINLPDQTMNIVGNITGNLSGSVGSVTGAVGSVTAGVSLAAGAVTNASLAGNMEVVFETDFATNYNTTRNAWVTNFTDIIGSYTAQTGDSFARLGAPAGASVSADIAAVKSDTAAVLVDTADMQPKLGTPAADVSADIAAVKADTAAILTDTGTTLDNHLTDIKGTGFVKDTNSLVDLPLATNYTATRAGYLDELAAANLPADIDQIKGDLPSRITKNTALNNFEFLMVASSDHVTPQTGLTVVVQRSIDGGAFGNATNTPATEVANGIYKINLSAADLNGDVITLRCTAATADDRLVTIVTQP